MADLEFDAQDIRMSAARSSGSGIFFDLVSGFRDGLQVRGRDFVVPQLAGRVAYNRVNDTRRIVLEGYVVGTSATDWASHTDTLMGVMVPAADPAVLEVDDDYLGTVVSWTINARVVNIIPGPITAQRFQTWSIGLESVDPDWAEGS